MTKPASEKQLQYLKAIRDRMGQEQPESDFALTSNDASLLIEQLKEMVMDTSNRPGNLVRETITENAGEVTDFVLW